MILKQTELHFFDCCANVKVESDSNTDSIILSITELSETKISNDHTSYEEASSTEIYIGPNEAKQIINALQNVVTEDDDL